MRKFILTAALLLFTLAAVSAQTKWYNPEEAGFQVIRGQGFQGEERVSLYNRFPDRAEKMIRKRVWDLSRQTAGESIRFTTNAKEIKVRYKVALRLAMNHMPMTGVSGVDLYTYDKHGNELWLAAKRSFKDTVVYAYPAIDIEKKPKEHTYTLFLPLYNEVTWMEIGTEEGASFRFEPLAAEKPIVAYGTSICQGACASRPGMTWTNILQRRIGHDVVNLGFSGNAYFEHGVIDLVSDIDASVYILDAMPNSFSIEAEPLRDTIMKAVRQIRAKRPDAPVLLTDHLGYPHGKAMPEYSKDEKHALENLAKAYEMLKNEGVSNLHYLTYDELSIPQDGFVEGIHASDYGMQAYAEAYEKKLREIMNEPAGDIRATVPTVQQRDGYNWMQRHAQILKDGEGKHFKRVLIGDSIMHFWGGVENAHVKRGVQSWSEFDDASLNMGCGYDRTENVLWRIYHGELDGFTADRITLMIGTNNLSFGDTDEQIAAGISMILDAIKDRRPEARITLMGVFPRRGREARVKELNKVVRALAKEHGVHYADPGKELVGKKGLIDEGLFTDGLHPNEEGYKRIVGYFM